jgi:hypothetical protein
MKDDIIRKEEFWPSWQVTEELDEATKEKRMRIIGQVQEADTINLNKRIYPKPVLTAAVDKYQSLIKDGRSFGEVDHPSFFGGSGGLKGTSHMVQKLWWGKDEKGQETNALMGEVLIFDTLAGQVVKEIVRQGGRPGFSSRGRGKGKDVKKTVNGEEIEVEEIEPGFEFEGFDFVTSPSVTNARILQVIEQVTKSVTVAPAPVKQEASMFKDLVELKEKQPALYTEMETSLKVAAEAGLQSLNDTIAVLKKTIADKDAELDIKNKELEGGTDVISAIIKVLKDAGYIKATDVGGGEKPPEKPTGGEGAEALQAQIAALTEDVEAHQVAVSEAEAKAITLEGEKASLTAEKALLDARVYLFEKTVKETFGAILREKLKDAKTREEIDKGIKDLTDFAKTTLATPLPEGKGIEAKVQDVEPQDAAVKAVADQTKTLANLKT